MVDFNKLLGSLNNSGISKGLLGGLAGGAVAGGLMSKSGRKTAKKALKYGGIAAVGGLAWQAYKNYQSNQSQPQTNTPHQASGQSFQSNQTQIPVPAHAAALQYQQELNEQQFDNLIKDDSNQSLFIVKTMVAAAMADGHLDGSEYQNIINKASELGLDADEQRIIFDEIKQPMPIDLIVAQTQSPVIGVEVYTASVLAIDETRPESHVYLNELAEKLNLPQPLVDSVHQQTAAIA